MSTKLDARFGRNVCVYVLVRSTLGNEHGIFADTGRLDVNASMRNALRAGCSRQQIDTGKCGGEDGLMHCESPGWMK
ncbi:MAG: hypothetical protein AB1768_08545 [Pseudomonadota bacterium]